MTVSEDFLAFVLDQLADWGGVTARKMFGGAGLYRNGKMFALISNDVAYLKVDDSNKDRFERAGSRPFKPYQDKPQTMSYYEIPPEVLEDAEALIAWSGQSLAIQMRNR
ncbi:MAG: TfoX/Sxy family protein [Anaerolineales bacterium]|nr:TfoX/Sxy family protein [Anaerolineales bacterium]